jgi:hypothetical protein
LSPWLYQLLAAAASVQLVPLVMLAPNSPHSLACEACHSLASQEAYHIQELEPSHILVRHNLALVGNQANQASLDRLLGIVQSSQGVPHSQVELHSQAEALPPLQPLLLLGVQILPRRWCGQHRRWEVMNRDGADDGAFPQSVNENVHVLDRH